MREFRKENEKGIVAIVTGIRKRMRTEKILIIVKQKEMIGIFTESMIPKRVRRQKEKKKRLRDVVDKLQKKCDLMAEEIYQ
jgi:hypothetical protein